MRRMTFLLITPLVLALSAAPPALAQDGDKDCADFSSQAEAQTYFEANGGSPTNNVDNLDADHDGQACEDFDYGATVEAAPAAAGQVATTASCRSPAPTTPCCRPARPCWWLAWPWLG